MLASRYVIQPLGLSAWKTQIHTLHECSSGGIWLSAEYIDKVGELVKKYGLKLHIDGARIFSALVALGVPVHRLVQAADSILALGVSVHRLVQAADSILMQNSLKSRKFMESLKKGLAK
ncbi:low-specificity L-threonine aldolase 1-like [Lycium barbarum]|uniref:low-specificity L-threonine aldolase 1-like n=1 Tax=Lycium barbarum TaxID=112863 RepID=UPI00293F36E6|nr:low-specificity L-threonine aldolase 1-like [Lycium barbarum]XP_060192639.1 low-specificity L-threonine aldolase 1-like [Lycium barbarum]XP_060192640.1 low-specificity L-threonine aldolase 1-like [Lycium barbarum]